MVIVIIIIIILALALLLFQDTGGKKRQEKVSPTATPTIMWITTTPTLPVFPLEKIEISGVKINDIYSKPISINSSKDVKFFRNENYEFVYLAKYNKFIITILGSPFMSLIKEAEEDFIRILDITKQDACRLNVDITTVISANPEYAGKRFSLSFCKG